MIHIYMKSKYIIIMYGFDTDDKRIHAKCSLLGIFNWKGALQEIGQLETSNPFSGLNT